MRITAQEAAHIKATAVKYFGEDCSVRLFGSRADDRKRGGDIDLFVDTKRKSAHLKKTDFIAALWDCIGLQKIDVLIHEAHEPLLPIHRDAINSGVEL